MSEGTRNADPEGVKPSGAQPRDNDHDQVPADRDPEHLSSEEYADLSREVERERDA